MALGTGQLTTSNVSFFLPDLWADELTARFKSNLVGAELIQNLDHSGKYGDVVHVPTSTRGSATNIFGAQGSELSFTAPTTNEFTITINQWWAQAKQIPDLVEKQSLPSLRKFIVNDLAYSLAVAIDNYLQTQIFATFRGGNVITGSPANKTGGAGSVIGGDGSTLWVSTTTGNATALSDVGIRRVMQTLDDLDVPGMDRFWLIPPVEKNRLLGVSRYTEQAFVGEAGGSNSIRTGLVGNLYGDPVYVSSNAASFFGDDDTTPVRQVIYAHKDSAILVNQIKPRVQAQYKLEFLSDAIVADCAFGAARVVTENTSTLDRGISIIVPA